MDGSRLENDRVGAAAVWWREAGGEPPWIGPSTGRSSTITPPQATGPDGVPLSPLAGGLEGSPPLLNDGSIGETAAGTPFLCLWCDNAPWR